MIGGFLMALLIIVSVLLCLLILFQETKGGGLAGALSGAGMKSAFGAKTAQKLTIFTAYVAAVFFALVMVLGVMGKQRRGIVEKGIKAAPQQTAPKEAAGPLALPETESSEGPRETKEPPDAAEEKPSGE